MEQKYKVLFNIFNQFLIKSGCDEASFEIGDVFDVWSGDKFYCRKDLKPTRMIPLPIPMLREISEYVEHAVEDGNTYYSDTGEEFYSFELVFKSKERLAEVHGTYSVYDTEDNQEQVIEAKEEPDVFDPIFDYLDEVGADILEVNVDAGGDSGWIEDESYDVNGKKITVSKEMQDVGYRLLNDHPGWEINEGSTSKFIWDRHRRILIFEFAYNVETQTTELISSEKY